MRLRFAALRTFYKQALREGKIRSNPVADLALPKMPRRLPIFLSQEQVLALLDAPRHWRSRKRSGRAGGGKKKAGRPIHPWQTLRDTAWLELFYSAGLRLSELVMLRRDQLNLTEGTVRVIGKGRKERLCPLGEPAVRALEAYLEACPHESAFLFVSGEGRRLDGRSVQLALKRYLAAAGLDAKLTPHKLRHTFATHLLDHAPTCAACRNCSATASSPPRRSTLRSRWNG